MYSKRVTEFQIDQLERTTRLSLTSLSATDKQQFNESVTNAFKANPKEPKLSPQQLNFVRTETLRCMVDFRYWLQYCKIEYDGCEGGGVGPFKLWEAQEIIMRIVEEAEEQCFEAKQQNQPSDGIRICDHKAKQLGGTALGRAWMMHRLTLWTNQRGIAGSIDNDKVQELYDRDKVILNNLPVWLKPSLDAPDSFDVKAQHIKFGALNSRILYQDSRQTSGMGQGRQFDLCHLTECSAWDNPRNDIELMTFPTLPQSWMTLALLESQPLGRGNWWHEFTERCRKNLVPGWKYAFVPWYSEPKKYRRQPPAGWKPSEASLNHAWRVYETSPEFLGAKVTLGREQLYWYETTRQQYLDSDSLNLFLTNYAATPEESFQHSTQSGFSTIILERMDHSVRKGLAYDLFKLNQAA